MHRLRVNRHQWWATHVFENVWLKYEFFDKRNQFLWLFQSMIAISLEGFYDRRDALNICDSEYIRCIVQSEMALARAQECVGLLPTAQPQQLKLV